MKNCSSSKNRKFFLQKTIQHNVEHKLHIVNPKKYIYIVTASLNTAIAPDISKKQNTKVFVYTKHHSRENKTRLSHKELKSTNALPNSTIYNNKRYTKVIYIFKINK